MNRRDALRLLVAAPLAGPAVIAAASAQVPLVITDTILRPTVLLPNGCCAPPDNQIVFPDQITGLFVAQDELHICLANGQIFALTDPAMPARLVS